MFKQGEEIFALRKHVGDECHHTVYKAEVIGLTLAAELIARESFIKDAMIGADNQVAIRVLENTRGSLGQHLVDQLQEKIEEIYTKHGQEALEIWCTPRHKGIEENERADKEAKKAAKGDMCPDTQLPPGCRGEIKTSHSMGRQHFTRQIKSEAAKQFAKSPRFPCLHEINPLSPSPKFHKDSECLQVSMLIQLRTGHIPLRKHLNRIEKPNSPMC